MAQPFAVGAEPLGVACFGVQQRLGDQRQGRHGVRSFDRAQGDVGRSPLLGLEGTAQGTAEQGQQLGPPLVGRGEAGGCGPRD